MNGKEEQPVHNLSYDKTVLGVLVSNNREVNKSKKIPFSLIIESYSQG